MNRFLKVGLLAAACLIVASCGSRTADSSQKGVKVVAGGTGYTGNDAEDLKNLNDLNYIEFTKGVFGVDVSPMDGWRLYKAKSPNKATNMDVIFTCPGEIDIDAIRSDLFARCQKVSDDGIFMVNVDWNSGKMSRGVQFANYSAFKAAGGEMWYYDYKGKAILCSPNINSAETSIIEYSFTLTK